MVRASLCIKNLLSELCEKSASASGVQWSEAVLCWVEGDVGCRTVLKGVHK